MTSARVTSRPPRRGSTASSTRAPVTRAPVTRGSTARQLAPAGRPRAGTRSRLEVVDARLASRRRLVRWSLRAVAVGTVGLLFLAVALHAEIAAQQSDLQKVRRAVATEQTRYGDLRLQQAQLSTPERIITEARRLGLVSPGAVKYLPSTGPTAPPDEAGGADDWTEVKPNLVPRP